MKAILIEDICRICNVPSDGNCDKCKQPGEVCQGDCHDLCELLATENMVVDYKPPVYAEKLIQFAPLPERQVQGKLLDSEKWVVIQLPTNTMNKSYTCSNCGRELQRNDNFCAQCGAELTNRYVHDILIQEDFRRFLCQNAATRATIMPPILIGHTKPTKMAFAICCYEKDHKWIVVQTDERAQPYNEKIHNTAEAACRDIAERADMTYTPSDTVQKTYMLPTTTAMLENENQCIEKALLVLRTLENAYNTLGQTTTATAHIRALEEAFKSNTEKLSATQPE